MIQSLIKLALLVVACILVYNYFFGTNEEQERSGKIFGELRGVVVSVGDLIKSEKAKFDSGKYDAALSKLGDAYKIIRTQAQHVDAKVIQRLDELDNRKSALQQELNDIKQEDRQLATPPAPAGKKTLKPDPKAEQAKAAKVSDNQNRKEALQKELESLIRDSDSLLQQAQQ